MQRRRPIQEHRMFADYVVKNIPDILALLLDHLLGTLDGRDVALFLELAVDERLEQFEGHLLGQTALMQPQLGTADDDRTPRIVNALAQQVLAEAARLALEHVGERLERTLGRTSDR